MLVWPQTVAALKIYLPPRGASNLRNTLVCGLRGSVEAKERRTKRIKEDYVRIIVCLVFMPRAAYYTC